MKELTQLQYFRMVARMENITKAAEQLHLSQPNLSRAIKRLEHDLGVPLFTRTGGRLRLNEYGTAYLEYVDKAFDVLDAGEHRLTEMLSSETKPRIAVASVMWHFLEDLIFDFTEDRPDVDVIFSYNQLEQPAILNELWGGSLDFALSLEAEYPPGIVWEPVFSCPICALAAQANPLSQRRCIRMAELKDEEFVCNNAGVNRNLTEQLCSSAGFDAHVVFESNEGPFAGNWLEKKDYVAFISAYDLLMLQQTGIKRPVKAIRLCDPEPMLTLGIAHPERTEEHSQKSAVCDIFHRYAKAYFSEQARKINAAWPNL